MTGPLFQILLGLVVLYGAGELLVRGAVGLAVGLGISTLAVGLLIVSFGTSAPELAVSLNAALIGEHDLAVANVIGSNICNIGLVVGLAGLLMVIRVDRRLVRVDMPIMLGCSLLLLLLLVDGRLGRIEGAGLLFVLMAWSWFTLAAGRRESRVAANARVEVASVRAPGIAVCGLMVIGGSLGLALGARFFVEGAVAIAVGLGVSPATIGLTVVAFGTSLPELAASVIAAARRQGNLAIGNIVGSNLFNILSILGITALVRPLVTVDIDTVDVWIMIGFAALLWLFMVRRAQITRAESAVLAIAYVAWVGWLVVTA